MNLKCLFGHSYKEINRGNVSIYGEDRTMPTDLYTNFLYQCTNCGLKKIQSLDGHWAKNIDDDNDDTPPSAPQLTPDDYYESIGK